MTTPSVWVHLYYKGKDEPEGQPVKVSPRRGDVADLKAVVLPKLEPTELAEIFVYPPGTTPPFSQDKALNSWDQIPSNSSGPQPLIVVAPNPRKQPSGDPGYPFNDSINTETGALPPTQQQIIDRSNRILDSWCQPLSEVPSTQQLSSVVKAPLPSPLPYGLLVASLDTPERDVMQLTNGDSTLLPDLGVIRDFIFSGRMFGDNEDSVHGLVDQMILKPMQLMGSRVNCNFEMQRNGVDSTGATLANLRPDVLVWLPSGVLAFKGEDKGSHHDLNVAQTELMTKLSCFTEAFFGSLPYQICYACGGYSLQFMAINRNAGGNPTIAPISPVINLSEVRGRSSCVRHAVNITRVLIAMQAAYPDGSVVKLGHRKKTANSIVQILGTYVIKKTPVYTSRDVLEELYDLIKRSHPPCLVFPKDLKFGRGDQPKMTLHISPVGFCGKRPGSLSEAKAAGRCVLQALQWLHTHNWVHRDIRPDNIMYADGLWYLMDLEWAEKAGSPIGKYTPNQEYFPPELAGADGGTWTVACDMWQFGKLVQFWNALDVDGYAYVTTQASTDPAFRLSAVESLTHQFFATE